MGSPKSSKKNKNNDKTPAPRVISNASPSRSISLSSASPRRRASKSRRGKIELKFIDDHSLGCDLFRQSPAPQNNNEAPDNDKDKTKYGKKKTTTTTTTTKTTTT